MSRLGEFLEQFFGPDPTFDSVHATVRHVKKSAPQESSSGQRLVIGRRRRDAKPSEMTEETLVFWARLPDRVRVETRRPKDGQAETSIEIVNGETMWTRHAGGTVERGYGRRRHSGGASSFPTAYQRHFDRGLLRECFAVLTLEAKGACQIANRECLQIRAIQVPGARLWPHWLTWETNEFEFAADVERAVLLSIAGMVDGDAIETHEVLEVAFDEEIDDSLFVYEPHANESVESAIPVVEHITLEAAFGRAPFTLLQTTLVPESQRIQREVMYYPTRPNGPDEYLSIHFRGGDSFDYLWINQRAERDRRMQAELQWSEAEKDGRRFEISDPSPDEGLRVIVFEHLGTYVDITSDLPSDVLVGIAMSMTPVNERDNNPKS